MQEAGFHARVRDTVSPTVRTTGPDCIAGQIKRAANFTRRITRRRSRVAIFAALRSGFEEMKIDRYNFEGEPISAESMAEMSVQE